MISSAWAKWGAPLALGLALACGTGAEAMAQLYFRPFFETFRYDIPPEDLEEAPRFASRRAVGRILAREGYRLVGPLGRRGDQLVATGVSRREGEMRFFIDPYEGEIIHAIPLGAPPRPGRARRDEGEFVPPLGGSRPVVKEFERGPDARERPRPSTGRSGPGREAPPAAEAARTPPRDAAPPAGPPASAPRANAPAPAEPAREAKPMEPAKPGQAWKPPQEPKPSGGADGAKPLAARPAEPAKPAEISRPAAADAKPADARPREARPADAAPGEAGAGAPRASGAKSPGTGPAGSAAPTPRATAARSTGGASGGSWRRAIVPPRDAGAAAVTPSTSAGSTAQSRTPESAASPR